MNGKKILVVDDDPGVIRLIETLLQPHGYEILTAADGEQGLKKAQDFLPDIIFLDIILPRLHGFEVCKRLKTDPKTRHIAVVIVSATGLEEVAKNEPDLHADACISKPFELNTLLRIIELVSKKG